MPTYSFAYFAAASVVALGALILSVAKGTPVHRWAGRVFAIAGLLAFAAGLVRYDTFDIVLGMAFTYQVLSGWHLVRRKERGPNWVDLLLLFCAIVATLALLPGFVLLGDGQELPAGSLIYASYGLLVFLVLYDGARWFFPPRWLAMLWPYDHLGRMIASLFTLLSATFLRSSRFLHTWLHTLPLALGLLAIVWFAWRQSRNPPVTRMGNK
jgi:hypothetical protein